MRTTKWLLGLAGALGLMATSHAAAARAQGDTPLEHTDHGDHAGRGDHGGRPGHERPALTEEQKKERHKARLVELKKRYGDLLKVPAFKEEMKLHAVRIAKLGRIARLAREEKKDDVFKRVEAARAKEKTRHEAKIDALKAAQLKDGGAK